MKILPAQLTCKTDFLVSLPFGSLPFPARLLHVSFACVCFLVSFQGAERMSICVPMPHSSISLVCSDLSTPLLCLTVEFCVFPTAPMTCPPWGLCFGFSVYQSLCLTSPDSSARVGCGGLDTSSISCSFLTLRSVVMNSFALTPLAFRVPQRRCCVSSDSHLGQQLCCILGNAQVFKVIQNVP